MTPPVELVLTALAQKLSPCIPCIKEAFAAAMNVCGEDDHLSDPRVFGMLTWQGTQSRLRALAAAGSFDMVPTPHGYAFEFMGYTLRFHRVNENTLVPLAGLAAKRVSRYDPVMGPDLFGNDLTANLGKQLVVGIVGYPSDGVKRIVVGEMLCIAPNKYAYRHEPVEVYASGATDTPAPFDTPAPSRQVPMVSFQRPMLDQLPPAPQDLPTSPFDDYTAPAPDA